MKYYLSAIHTYKKDIIDNGLFKTILSSYALDSKQLLPYFKEKKDYDLLIDSGAFSIYNSGKSIDIDDYKNFILQYPKKWNYINLDVIPPRSATKKQINKCAEEGYENYIYLKKYIKNLLPVYHYGEDIKFFKKYCNETDYIGINIKRVNRGITDIEYYDSIFNISKTNIKIHCLGMTNIPHLLRYPFYSTDSVSYARFKVSQKSSYWVAANHLRSFLFINLRYWKYIETQITNIWKERGVIWD